MISQRPRLYDAGSAGDIPSSFLGISRPSERGLKMFPKFSIYVGSVGLQSSLGDRAFQSAAPKLWNSLPAEIRNIQTLTSFKRALKTYFFKTAFN